MTTTIAEAKLGVARKRIELHDGQTAIMQADARFLALIAGGGGGKSFCGPYWLAGEIAKSPQGTFGVGAPTYKILNRVTAPELVRAYNGTTLEGEYKASLGEYHLPTGGIIYLTSTDIPDHMEGGQYDAWWLDEAGQMKRWVWMVVQARLGMKQGRLLMTTTPYSLNWLYSEIYLRAKEGDPDYFVSQFASISNPYYPQEEFERAKKTMDERTFALRYKGEFRKMAGLVYPDIDSWVCQLSEIEAVLAKAREFPESVRWVGGIDWGYSNPFVALSAVEDSDGILWVYNERCLAQTLLADHARYLDKQTVYHADPSGRQMIEEMISLDIIVEPGLNDVQMGIERVITRGKQGRLKISPQCKYLLSEAETYRYKEGTDKPVKEKNHCVDGLRYMVMGLDGKPEPKIININLGLEPGETSDGEDIMATEDPRYWREM